MRSYLSLAEISAKAHRRNNRVTQLCIMIAVVLVISVFSIGVQHGGLRIHAHDGKAG